MYTLSYNIHDRTGIFRGDSYDEVFDRFCTLMCNHYDEYTFDNKIADTRSKYNRDLSVEFQLIQESADIVDTELNKVGHYTIKKD